MTPAIEPRTAIALCADDYGQHPGIDEGILDLVAGQRLSAVSCFSMAPNWRAQAAPALREHLDTADIGLHFNLTEGFGTQQAPYSLRGAVLRGLLGRLDRNLLKQSLHTQLDAFEAGLGRAPDYIDGHQHVHQLPGMREVLLEVLESRYAKGAVWVRNTVPASPVWRGKPVLLKWLGGADLAQALRERGIPSNRGFAGVYGFDRPDYETCFATWLEAARPGMLIMCHPAIAVGEHDPIAAQRVVEYRFFKSLEFFEMLDRAGLRLARLSRIG